MLRKVTWVPIYRNITTNSLYKTVSSFLLFLVTQLFLVEEDPRCPFGLISSRTDTWVEPPTFRKPAGKLPHVKNSMSLVGLEPTAVRGK